MDIKDINHENTEVEDEKVKQYQKTYRLQNKDKIKEYNKTYYTENRDKIISQLNEKVACKLCNRVVRHQRLTGHQNTKLCLNNRNKDIKKEYVFVSSNPFKTSNDIEKKQQKNILENMERDIALLYKMFFNNENN
jgi:hypothetical protein